MRKATVAVVVTAIASLAPAGTAGGDRPVRQVSPPGRVSASRPGGVGIHVPAGWRRLHGWLSDVTDPAPVVAVASFPARLSRDTCSCGFPNVVDFPRNGAFIFVWEYGPSFSRQSLGRMARRPARFHLARGAGVRHTCADSSDTLVFREAGHVFQVEVYLGPAAGRALRAQTLAALDSLRA